MEWSREYLQRHNIHRLLESCVEDLIVERPETKDGVTKCIVRRIEAVRNRFDSPPQRVVFVLAAPGIDPAPFVKRIADEISASVVDGAGLTAERLRGELLSANKTVFILNFPAGVKDAIAFEGCFGKPHRAVLFRSAAFLASTPRTAAAFQQYARGVNAVAEYFAAKQQLGIVEADSATDAPLQMLRDAMK